MSKQIQTDLFNDIRKLEQKYSLSYKEIKEILDKKNKICIPFSIFNDRLGSLESIVKYLRENIGLSFKEISFLTNRKIQPIRTTYLRAGQKYSQKFYIREDKTIPLSIIQNRKFSVLENLVLYLLKRNYSPSKISFILRRDYQTIWTIKNRIIKKS